MADLYKDQDTEKDLRDLYKQVKNNMAQAETQVANAITMHKRLTTKTPDPERKAELVTLLATFKTQVNAALDS